MGRMGDRRYGQANGVRPVTARSRLALVPICLEQSSQDPQVAATLAQLKDTNSYQRSDLLMKAGWATMPGSSDPNRDVARACMEKLAAQF